MVNNDFSHLDNNGQVRMVDVGEKTTTERRAVFTTTVKLSARTFKLLQEKALAKGDVLTTAKIAGIQAAKRTAHLIPLCHPVFLTQIDIQFHLKPSISCIIIEAEAKTEAKTGVEMEALVAAQVAAITIYDMCKKVQRDIQITDCRLIYKSGGQSGTYENK